MLSIEEAWTQIMRRVQPLAAEHVPLADAHGRSLAARLPARHDLPGFDNSAMDGYAVRCGEVTADPQAAWPLRGEARAGGEPPDALPARSVMRIFTGAQLPSGADTVVMQENAQVEEGPTGASVRFTAPPRFEGQHVRRRGSDLEAGAPALGPGQPLGPGELALLAAQGYPQVPVFRRPKVAILCTGDELCDVDGAGRPGRVVNSNAYALAAQVREAGAEVLLPAPAADTVESVVARVHEVQDADVLLSAGGVSVGDYDVVGQALAAVGVERHFWKVAIKPGKPLFFGTLRGRPVFGLPGNPISAMVTFEVFVRPALRGLQGDARPFRSPLPVRLSAARKHGHGRTECVRARLRFGGGTWWADVLQNQGSGALPSMVDVDALLFLPPGPEVYAEGEEVLALPLRPLRRARNPLSEGAGEAAS